MDIFLASQFLEDLLFSFIDGEEIFRSLVEHDAVAEDQFVEGQDLHLVMSCLDFILIRRHREEYVDFYSRVHSSEDRMSLKSRGCGVDISGICKKIIVRNLE